MRYALIALSVLGVVAGTSAQAQYYGPPQRYYGPPPGNYYDEPPNRYYGPPPDRYYGRQRYYPYGDTGQPLGAPVRTGRGDPGSEPWRPRVDPRNGGLYCVQAGFTVQDGVCKPGRPY